MFRPGLEGFRLLVRSDLQNCICVKLARLGKKTGLGAGSSEYFMIIMKLGDGVFWWVILGKESYLDGLELCANLVRYLENHS